MPQFNSNAANTATVGLGEFVMGYIVAAYFTETGDSEQPSSEATISNEAIATAVTECEAFQAEAKPILDAAYLSGYTETQAGHDFWFTRNGHGVGYWCRDELTDEQGDSLSDIARRAGEVDLYEGDDGLLYFA